ncbi:unnamed protein product [Phyllotreta striolata]|uniref:Uncharacterized protein n=1 Tax=Phyllotreta striolata TaxID=444603 RepID=A0A9N9XS07_PHYSR|nr:unnamed protein product [Phyllotreta striolata]
MNKLMLADEIAMLFSNILRKGLKELHKVIFIVHWIILCERVENSGNKLARKCIILHTDVKEPRLKQDLKDLSVLIEALPLRFTIAGFYKINKQLIPSLLGGITSYLIILIQFRFQGNCQ